MAIEIGKDDNIVTYKNEPDVNRELFPNTGSSGSGGGGTGGITFIIAHMTIDAVEGTATLDITPSDIYDASGELVKFPMLLFEDEGGASYIPASQISSGGGEWAINITSGDAIVNFGSHGLDEYYVSNIDGE